MRNVMLFISPETVVLSVPVFAAKHRVLKLLTSVFPLLAVGTLRSICDQLQTWPQIPIVVTTHSISTGVRRFVVICCVRPHVSTGFFYYTFQNPTLSIF
jgi:hypothetical protein